MPRPSVGAEGAPATRPPMWAPSPEPATETGPGGRRAGHLELLQTETPITIVSGVLLGAQWLQSIGCAPAGCPQEILTECLLHAMHPTKCLTYVISLSGGHYCHLHFSDEESEAQESK